MMLPAESADLFAVLPQGSTGCSKTITMSLNALQKIVANYGDLEVARRYSAVYRQAAGQRCE
jgi:hypothetical protein